MILPVIHVYARDEHLVRANLEACVRLDGKQEAHVLVASDDAELAVSIGKAAEAAFTSVGWLDYQPWTGEQAWPRPQNWAWQKVCRMMNGYCFGTYSGWLWWEADACPIRAGWLKALSTVHESVGRRFSGHLRKLTSGPYMNGVGIYPMRIVDALADCAALYVRDVPFDIAAGPEVMRSFTPLNHMMLHHVKLIGGGVGQRFDKAGFKSLLKANPDAVFYHGCADGSLPRALLGKFDTKPVSTRSVFYHSGDYGDVVYSLLTMRELGGGDLFLGPDNRTNMATRQKFTEAAVAPLIPLLESQAYVHRADFSELTPEDVRYDLNQMRLLLRNEHLDLKPGFNLARCYLQAFGLALENDANQWLTVEPRAVAPVVISRSPRYNDPRFRWDRVMAAYRGNIVFIGQAEEHAVFCRQWGHVPHEPTKNLLEAAHVIAGAKLFAGNQSCPYAIAEGLKKPALLEVCPAGSNTLFDRVSVVRGVDSETALPSVDGLSVSRQKLAKKITISGPIDYFTGLGRATCQLITQAFGRYKVSVEPLSVDRRLPWPGAVAGLVEAREKADGPRLLVCPLLDVPKRLHCGDVLLTMWESTRISPQIVDAINDRAALLLTPSSWCATVFGANGVTAPIKLTPLGVEPAIYKPSEPKPKGFVIGAAGRLAHGGKRKGIEDVIAAFKLAFPKGNEKVQLSLKLFDDCYVPPFKDKRIAAHTRLMTDEQMVAWYRGLTMFICASKGEGWGLHAHEALACGIPAIGPFYSGLGDVLVHGGTAVPYEIVPASEGYFGQWCQPSVEGLAEAMLRSYAPPEPLKHLTPEAFAASVFSAML